MGGDVGECNSISIQVCKGVTEPLKPTEHLQKICKYPLKSPVFH